MEHLTEEDWSEGKMNEIQLDEEKSPSVGSTESPRPAPAEVFHVIDFIREEMDERNWPIWTLVRRMSVDQSDEALGRIKLALELLELREPDMLIGEEVAAGLARAFGTGQEIWLNMDKTWRNAQHADDDLDIALRRLGRDGLNKVLRETLGAPNPLYVDEHGNG